VQQSAAPIVKTLFLLVSAAPFKQTLRNKKVILRFAKPFGDPLIPLDSKENSNG